MKIIVAGGSGFIGEPLVKHLLARGDEVFVLTRNPAKLTAGRALLWDGKAQGPWSEDVATADVVVNLAGENLSEGRWTQERKRKLIESRLDSTRALVEAMRTERARKRTFISASAVGAYGDRGDEEIDESSRRGHGFLADLTDQWERAARSAESISRLIIVRFGVVLGSGGGALRKMLLPFRLGVGGTIAGGDQWMSWIDRDDLIRMIAWLIDSDEATGVYNATSPQPVRSRELTRELARTLHRPAFLPTPAFVLRLLFGQMAEETVIEGQRVLPHRAEAEGFRFETREVAKSLAKQLG